MVTDPDDAPLTPPAGVGRAALGGFAHTGGSQAIRALLMFASTLILARLLSPEDFGVVAMAAPFLAILLLFQDLGLSAATIQARTISDEQSNTLFWVTVAASACFALLLLAAAPLVGRFYHDARVGYVTAASAGILLLTSSALQPTALLSREMKFRVIARIVVASAVATFLATVLLAVLLRSYWAIVLGNVAGAAVQVASTWALQSWRPRARVSFRGAGAMLRFGGSVAGFDLLNFFARNADNILVGRYWGAGALGFYERSYALMMAPLQLINGPLGRVMLPVLSRLRDEPVRYRTAFLSSLRGLLLATTPAAALAVGTSDQLVPLLLGPNWAPASPIFFWLAIGCLYQPLGSSMGLLFTSTGRGRDLVKWALLSSATILLSFAIGLPFGAAGVAKAYVIVGLINLPVLVSWASRSTPVRGLDIYGLLVPYAAAAIITIAVLQGLAGFVHPVAVIALGLPAAYAVAAACMWSSPSGREFMRTTFRVGTSMLLGKSRAGD